MNTTSQLDLHPDAESLNAFAEQALAAEPGVKLAATVERLPTRDGTDGAFAAAFVRHG